MSDLIVVHKADLEALSRKWVAALLASAKPVDTEHEALRAETMGLRAENKALREAAEATGRDLGRLRDAMQESLHGIEDVRAGLEDLMSAIPRT